MFVYKLALCNNIQANKEINAFVTHLLLPHCIRTYIYQYVVQEGPLQAPQYITLII